MCCVWRCDVDVVLGDAMIVSMWERRPVAAHALASRSIHVYSTFFALTLVAAGSYLRVLPATH